LADRPDAILLRVGVRTALSLFGQKGGPIVVVHRRCDSRLGVTVSGVAPGCGGPSPQSLFYVPEGSMPADRVGGQGGVSVTGPLAVVKRRQGFDMGRMPVPAGRNGIGIQVWISDEERFHPAAQILELFSRFLRA
jgi:hypothetical protein